MLTLFKTKLINKINLANNVYSFTFQLVDPPEINFVAGQYLMLRVLLPNGTFIIRQLSMITAPTQKNEISFLFKVMPGGAASEYLIKAKSGEEIFFQGPAGKFALKESSNNKVFLATGTGIAPVWSMLRETRSTKHEAQSILLWGIQKIKDVYYFEELKQLEKENKNFHFYYCLSKETNLDAIAEEDREYFILGRVNQALEKVILGTPSTRGTPESNSADSGLRTSFFARMTKKQISNFDYYLCGGRDIIESLKIFLLNKGVAKENIVFEKF